ncbi:MAG TPA: hypothetical protein VLK84_17035 [Longimicrobium sp.]|nr:hypothetical protein [Longimicrobium sp.]
MPIRFAGLDGEMTGPRVSRHKLFEIAIALEDGPVFSSRIGWEEFEFDPEALQAVGVTPDSIREGPPAAQVDEAAAEWLAAQGVEPHSLVVAGWGVTTFDMPFVATTLPGVMRYLHHHTIELNALCYTLGGNKPYAGERPEAATWKAMARVAAEVGLELGAGLKPQWHSAAYDARASLASWQWLRAIAADPLPGNAAPIAPAPLAKAGIYVSPAEAMAAFPEPELV